MSKLIPERLIEARERKGWSQGRLAKAVGTSQQAVGKMEKGRTANPGSIRKIAAALGVDVEWLMGETDTRRGTRELDEDLEDRDYVIVPEYDVKLAAGDGFAPDEGIINDAWPFSQQYINELRLPATQLMLCVAEGDSMTPTLFSGDRIMVNRMDTNPARPGIFGLWDGGALVVKRVEKIPASDPVKLRLISDNPLHGAYEVLAEDTNIIGRVVWFARRM